MSHAHPGGQAPDQASSGRQTGAAAHTRTDHSQGTQSGQSLDESHAARQQPGWQRSQTDQHAESYRPLNVRPVDSPYSMLSRKLSTRSSSSFAAPSS
jgi:hypothetical protein